MTLGAQDRLAAALATRQTMGGLIGRVAVHLLHLLGTDVLPRSVGPGLRLPHSSIGAVVHPYADLGANVTILHGATIGRADLWQAARPDTRITVGDGVIFGANCTCLVKSGHHLRIGDGAVIGAGAVVTQDVPANEVWAGNPARRISTR